MVGGGGVVACAGTCSRFSFVVDGGCSFCVVVLYVCVSTFFPAFTRRPRYGLRITI